MSTKKMEYLAQFKSTDELEPGTFSALVSVFGNVDRQGDRVMPGAFTKTLREWRKSGNPIPIVFAHQWEDIMAHIGYANAKDVEETSRGLEIKKGYLDVMDNPIAAQAYRLMKRGTLTNMSFAYEPIDENRDPKDEAFNVNEVKLFEMGPCLIGANPEAHLTGIKSAVEKSDVLTMVATMLEEAGLRPKAVDESSWDGNKAMGQCSSASDYRSICAGEHNAGEPDQRQHWALPHHYLGKGPNANGVTAALGRLNQTQDLKNKDAAKSHLQAHQRQTNPDAAGASGESFVKVVPVIDTENLGRVKDAVEALNTATTSLTEALETLNIEPQVQETQTVEDETKTEESEVEAKVEESELQKLKDEIWANSVWASQSTEK